MKNTHPVITLLGSNSGNNAGDAAILSSILEVLTSQMPNAEFLVPSTKPSFTKNNYGSKYNVKGINVMPWTGSIRLLGIPVINCFRKSDVALICDGIIFGKKLFNPLFNFLITLFFLIPFAKLFNCKLVCYCTGIGPFRTEASKWMAKILINNCDLVLMRERDSLALCKEIGVTKEVILTGDAAFINKVSSDARTEDVAKAIGIELNAPLFGINVTNYLDQWLAKDERVSSKKGYENIVVASVNNAKAKISGGFTPVLFSTHPMDISFAKRVALKTNGKFISNTEYLSHDLMGIMKRCSLFIGMRFHSLVLASAVEAPIIGLVYAPKVRSYMRLLECTEYSLELADLTEEKLTSTIIKGWQNRKEIQRQQKLVVDELKEGARRAAVILTDRFFTPKFSVTEIQASA